MINNTASTVYHFKRLHGRLFQDHSVQAEKASLPYDLVPLNYGKVGVKVNTVFISPIKDHLKCRWVCLAVHYNVLTNLICSEWVPSDLIKSSQ